MVKLFNFCTIGVFMDSRVFIFWPTLIGTPANSTGCDHFPDSNICPSDRQLQRRCPHIWDRSWPPRPGNYPRAASLAMVVGLWTSQCAEPVTCETETGFEHAAGSQEPRSGSWDMARMHQLTTSPHVRSNHGSTFVAPTMVFLKICECTGGEVHSTIAGSFDHRKKSQVFNYIANFSWLKLHSCQLQINKPQLINLRG